MPASTPIQVEPRPSAGLSIRLTAAQRDALERIAHQQNATISATARAALSAGLRALGAGI